MTKFIVKTQTSANESNLHSVNEPEFVTSSEQAAREMYEKEVAELGSVYKTTGQLDFSPTDYEASHAFYVTIYAMNSDDDCLEAIETSEEFYNL